MKNGVRLNLQTVASIDATDARGLLILDRETFEFRRRFQPVLCADPGWGCIPPKRMSIHESRASRNRGGLGMMPLGVSFRSIPQTKETGYEDFGNRFGKDQERRLCV
jgi:hypothetical protein